MTDPVLALINHELGKLQTLHAFKMAGIVRPARDKFEDQKIKILKILKTIKWHSKI